MVSYFFTSPKDLWTPIGGGELFRAFLTVGLILCGVLILYGPTVSAEDSEVRDALRGPYPKSTIVNPLAGGMYFWIGIGAIACAVLVIRYLYLIVTRFITGVGL